MIIITVSFWWALASRQANYKTLIGSKRTPCVHYTAHACMNVCTKSLLHSSYSHVGLLVIPNPFLPCGQHHWVKQCLVDYPIKPNVCNLDAHMTRPGNGRLWPITPTPATKTSSVEHKCSSLEDTKIPSKHPSSTETVSVNRDSLVRVSTKDQSLKHAYVSSEDVSVTNKPPNKRMKWSEEVPLPAWLSKDSMLYKLRWVTLGYHYNWSDKEYSPDHKSTFPEELGKLSSFVLSAVGFPE